MSNLFKINHPGGLLQPFQSLFDEAYEHAFINKTDLGLTLPAANIREGIKHYSIALAIPGYSKENFKIELDKNNRLTISGEMEEELSEQDEKLTRREFGFNTFSRSFNLPEDIDKQAITARYELGILHIQLPKLDKLHPLQNTKTIEVK